MVLPATPSEEVDDYGDDQDDQIDAGKRPMRINHPGVRKSCEGQKDESKQQHNQAVIGALKIIREEKDEQQRNSRKSQQ